MKVLGEDFDVDVIFKEVDRDQDGKINIEEFMAHLRGVQSFAVDKCFSEFHPPVVLGRAGKLQKSTLRSLPRRVGAWFAGLCGP